MKKLTILSLVIIGIIATGLAYADDAKDGQTMLENKATTALNEQVVDAGAAKKEETVEKKRPYHAFGTLENRD